MSYWSALAKLVEESTIKIDRPKGTAHPKYQEVIYPLDYGYLENTTSMDGGGIDILVGSSDSKNIFGVICTIDSLKKDAEIKVLYKCSEEDGQIALSFFNNHYLNAILVKNA